MDWPPLAAYPARGNAFDGRQREGNAVGGMKRNLARILGGIAAVGAVGIGLASKRSKISPQAWAIIALLARLSPDMGRSGGIEGVVERDRARGPARPSKGLLKRIDFHDEGQGPDRRFRASRKGEAPNRLRLLYLHGGAYVMDLQALQWRLVDGLLKRVGGEVVIPIYPLAPEHGWQDSAAAAERAYLALVAAHGAANVVIVGDSAGGGLALALAQKLRDEESPAPAALLLLSPWLDVGASGADQPALEADDPVLSINVLRECGRLWAKGLPLDDPRISPLFGDQDRLPPTMVLSGTRDILDSDARRLAQANPDAIVYHYPGMVHDWPIFPVPEARRALDQAAAFIRHSLPGL